MERGHRLGDPRLRLRTYHRDDLPLLAELNADPEVVRHLGGLPLTRSQSDRIAAWAQRCHAEEGIGLLAVKRREDSAFLGRCGLHHQEPFPDDVQVTWRLAHRFWGHGYATESAAAWLDHEAEVVDSGATFTALICSITADRWGAGRPEG